MKVFSFLLLFVITLSAAASGSADEKDVLAAMNAYKAAYLSGNGPAMDKLLGKDLVYIHSQGDVRNKAETVQQTAAGPSPQRLEFLPDTTVRVHGTVALVAGHEDIWENQIVKHMYVLVAWEKTSLGWQMINRQATLIGIDPAAVSSQSAHK
jgi:uncharacterized protein DUF4440